MGKTGMSHKMMVEIVEMVVVVTGGDTGNCADGGKGDGDREEVVEDGRDGGGSGAGSFACT